MKRSTVVTVALGVLCLGACASDVSTADRPNPSATTPSTAATPTVPASTSPTATDATRPLRTPVGFDSVTATITSAVGEVCEVCLWLADDADLRARGLMRVDSVGDADGMAFVYQSDVSSRFWMKNTEIALSIAYFDVDGTYLGQNDMAPCVTTDCVRYDPPAQFRIAVEVPLGELDAFGIGPGSVLRYTPLPCSGV